MGDHRIKSDLEIHWLEGWDKTREDFEIVKLYLVMSDVMPIKAGTSTGDEFFPADYYVNIPRSDDLSVYDEDEDVGSKKRKRPSWIIVWIGFVNTHS